jgi:hypothetical protein
LGLSDLPLESRALIDLLASNAHALMNGWLNAGGQFFNPSARVSTVPIDADEVCIVVDDALANPAGLVDWAAAQSFHSLGDVPYPGIVRDAPSQVTATVAAYFAERIRGRLGGRRTLSVTVRLSIVTLAPADLRPVQWQCHRDRLGPATRDVRLAAMVAYLFRAPEFGGTSFYKPRQSEEETQRIISDAGQMDARDFSARYGLEPSYLSESNRYFERIAQIPAAWNRMLFYSGDLFHSGDIGVPGHLSADVRAGRLTLNGFFACSPALR